MIVQQINQDSKTILDIPIAEDDTIEMIKYKISESLGCQPHEIYLFANQLRKMNVHTLYEELMKKTETIVKEDVEHVLADLSIEPKKQLKAKEYTYDDLLSIIDIQDEHEMTIPIGHILRECANPFLCKKQLPFNSVDYRILKQVPSNLQKTLLLDYLPFLEDTLYVVQQSNVDNELQPSYFEPASSIDDLSVLKSRIDQKANFLSNEKESKITASFIRSITFTILPTHQISLSLESIFNLFHATENYPMIHYYTGKTVLYKLYTKQKDIYDKKIPFLPESVVYHVGDKDIKVKSVNIYLDNRNSCVMFYENGSINVYIKKNKAIAEEELNTEIQKLLLPILSMVKEPVYQSGYTYPWSESTTISASNVKVDFIEYVLQVNTNILDHKDKLPYVSNVCLDISLKEEDRFIYLYTSEMNMSQLYEQVIKYVMTKVDTKKKIIQKIKSMFQLSEDDANTLFTTYAPSEETAIHQPNINIGFKVTFLSSPPSVIIEGINNIHYLPSIKRNFNCLATIVVKDVKDIKQDVQKETVAPIQQTVVEDFQDEPDLFGGAKGGGVKDLDNDTSPEQYHLKNGNFAVTRLKHVYNLKIPGIDYNKKCLRQFVPIIISKREWESEKYKTYRDRLDTMENGDKYVSLQDDHVLLCPKYWSFKKSKAYLDEGDFETPREKKDIFEYHVNSKETRYKLNQDSEYYEYPTYHHDAHVEKPAKYPYFMEGNLPCCGGILHKKKDEHKKEKDKEKPKELTTNQYIVGKVEPIDTQEGTFKFGYLPEPLIDFFDLTDKKVFRSSVDTTPYELLRWGVPNKQYQFLYTMHTIYKLTKKAIDFKTYIQGMKNDFKYIQNGNISNKYLSFQDFTKDTKNITHEEGWELVTRFHNYNIIIFKDNDNFVELLCPSNSYGKQFDVKKQSIILYYFEKDNCYEPIIKKPQNKNTAVSFVFDTNDPLVKDALHTIQETYKKCKPIIDYELDGNTPTLNITSVEMYDRLYDEYEEIQQVTQNNKCIGFVINHYYVPCYPSEIIRELEEIHTPPLQKIEPTLTFLTHLYTTLQLPCQPRYKVINKNEIIGILTETFHYVPCINAPNSKKIKLEPYYGNLKHEFVEFKENIEDVTRISNTNRIKYEQYGFTYCKNQLMIALNLHTFADQRIAIKKIIHSNKSYVIKLKEVTDRIHKVLRSHLHNKIEWVNAIPEEYVQDMLDQCPNGFCNASKMYLPKINLVTYEKNDYYKLLADELIRNKQIELFVLKPEIQFFVPYQADDQELILDGNVIETYLKMLDKPSKSQRYYDNINVLPTEQYRPLLFSCTKLERITITE
jgi:hypothetical protein